MSWKTIVIVLAVVVIIAWYTSSAPERAVFVAGSGLTLHPPAYGGAAFKLEALRP